MDNNQLLAQIGQLMDQKLDRLGQDLRQEMGQMGQDLRQEMGQMEGRLRQEMTELRQEMTEFKQDVMEAMDAQNLYIDKKMQEATKEAVRQVKLEIENNVTTHIRGLWDAYKELYEGHHELKAKVERLHPNIA